MPPIQAQIDGIGTLEFPEGTDPEVVHQTVRRVVMNHQATQSAVPQALQGGPDPEYKPFLSPSNLLDEGTGVLKSGASTVAAAGRGLSHVPVIGSPVMDPQKIADLEHYSEPANKGEQFGKVLGTIGQAIPAIYGGGEFAGGMYDELAPLGAAAMKAGAPVLGRVAGTLGKRALQGAGAGATLYGLSKLKELFE